MRHGGLHGLQVGRVVGVERLQPVRRPEVPAQVDRPDAEPLRPEVRHEDGQGGCGLPKQLRGTPLLLVDGVDDGRLQQLRELHRPAQPHPRPREGCPGQRRLPLHRDQGHQVLWDAAQPKPVSIHQGLHNVQPHRVQFWHLERVVRALLPGPLRAEPRHHGDEQRMRHSLRWPAPGDQELPRGPVRLLEGLHALPVGALDLVHRGLGAEVPHQDHPAEARERRQGLSRHPAADGGLQRQAAAALPPGPVGRVGRLQPDLRHRLARAHARGRPAGPGRRLAVRGLRQGAAPLPLLARGVRGARLRRLRARALGLLEPLRRGRPEVPRPPDPEAGGPWWRGLRGDHARDRNVRARAGRLPLLRLD
mmetsp:Transcript_12503/g.36410  ORF Transcript_12503/g.36410 Transcript_12503/m.36410 type:complete len:363 (+) Transcript_12503:74-1162(+)